jgi:predicted transcriptional regulator of viral defense system
LVEVDYWIHKRLAEPMLATWALPLQVLCKKRRGLYGLAPPYQKAIPEPFLLANRLVRSSYVSLESALAYHGLIPEHVPVVTSVTTARPGRWVTPLGTFMFRHIKSPLFGGYHLTDLSHGQQAFVATPEKALLDLIYLTPNADSPQYLRELRLQNMEALDQKTLHRQADKAGSAKLRRAATLIADLAQDEAEEYATL